MSIDELRTYVEFGFRIAFGVWFLAFAATAAQLGWNALRLRSTSN